MRHVTGLSEILNHKAQSSPLLDTWAKEIRFGVVSSALVKTVMSPCFQERQGIE